MWTCATCHEKLEDQFDSCWNCGTENQRTTKGGRTTSSAEIKSCENQSHLPEGKSEETLLNIIEGLAGQSSKASALKLQHKLDYFLIQNEQVEVACRAHRHVILFTSKRIVFVDMKGITGIKVEYQSIPYRSITHFSIETAGPMDLDSSLTLWLTGNPEPIEEVFPARLDLFEVQAVLAKHL